MWARAVEQRILIAQSSDSKLPITCDVLVHYKVGKSWEIVFMTIDQQMDEFPTLYKSPTMLPGFDNIRSIEISSK